MHGRFICILLSVDCAVNWPFKLHCAYLISNLQEAAAGYLELDAAPKGLVDVVGLSLGLNMIGRGSASFANPVSAEAQKISEEAAHKVHDRTRAVSNFWMKETLLACGLVASQASDQRVGSMNCWSGRWHHRCNGFIAVSNFSRLTTATNS